jgi:hypothetical protein
MEQQHREPSHGHTCCGITWRHTERAALCVMLGEDDDGSYHDIHRCPSCGRRVTLRIDEDEGDLRRIVPVVTRRWVGYFTTVHT